MLTDGKKDVVTNGMSQGGAVGGASLTGPIDEDLFDDEDLDELEEDLENLEVWYIRFNLYSDLSEPTIKRLEVFILDVNISDKDVHVTN